MPKVLINLYIEDEQKTWLAGLDRPVAETIRDAIERYRVEYGELDDATKLASTMYPGMTSAALQQRIRQDWLHDRISGGKRQLIKEETGKIHTEVEALREEVKALRFAVGSLIEKLNTT